MTKSFKVPNKKKFLVKHEHLTRKDVIFVDKNKVLV